MGQKPAKKKPTATTGRVLDDGTLIDLVYDRASNATALCVHIGETISIEQTLTSPH